jgi:hypothetical protein
MKKLGSAKLLVVISLVLCLVSAIGASMVQSGGGSIKVKDLRWETPAGRMMSALLFVPPNATSETPAPGIVTSHGWYNNREMQDLNYVEWARRGYVVMTIDMYGHGNSDNVYTDEWEYHGTGMYDAVLLMNDLPYVDSDKIGITGHSNGARAANWTIDEDNRSAEPIVDAVLLVANDATYKNPDTEAWWNKYGSRDVGIIAAQFDEFFFRVAQEDGSRSRPQDYIHQATAQSFLNYGADPATGLETRTTDVFYHQTIDGVDAVRVIHQPYQIHPWNHFSAVCAALGINYFQEVFGAPNPIDAGNQVWQWKVVFNTIGLIGMFIFMVNFAIMLLDTKVFASLKAGKSIVPGELTAKSKPWFWGGLVLCTAFGAFAYRPIYAWCNNNRPAGIFTQAPVYFIGVWTLCCALFSLLVLFLSYRLQGKASGVNLRENGAIISAPVLGKTIILALTVVASTFSLVILADYFFKVDFRIWVIAFKAFTPDKLGITLVYLPFFLVYYIINSIAINSFNFVKLGGKDWMNIVVLAIFNSLGILIWDIIQYGTFFGTGEMFFTTGGGGITGIWLFPIIVILPLAAVISRKLYKATGNPYIAGIIMATMVTIMSCTNTLTQFAR